MEKLRAEIRCCCNAGKLLGTVEIKKPLEQFEELTFKLKNGGSVVLPVGVLHSLFVEKLAIKSMDMPIEVLREIPSFEET